MSRPLYSWGRYPYTPQTGHCASWREEWAERLKTLGQTQGTTLPYGNGRSYGDSCMAASGHVLEMRSTRKFIAADWATGTVTAEAGVTLADVLALSVPQGWFLPVTPGTQFATLGGAIANDVHGKNHHVRGTFGRHVQAFELVRSEGILHCSATENPALFAATIGGLGLTGVVTWATFQLMPIRSTQLDTQSQRFGNIAEFFSLSNELDHQHEYSVAWVDCLARGQQLGRGAYFTGDHATYGEQGLPHRKKLSVPLTPPLSLINKLSLRAFNELYWRRQPSQRRYTKADYEPFFYPLDSLLHWNRIYGPRGFRQYQCVIPENDGEYAVRALLETIATSNQGSFLAVLKRCGDLLSPGVLSFPLKGVSLALDFPVQHRNRDALFTRLDAIVREANGRLYPAKDAHMAASDFQRGYPSWETLERQRDPSIQSAFWARVTA
jgi:FAD/FMN-containing dehydrogenase